jgi:predicted phosphodiesterase
MTTSLRRVDLLIHWHTHQWSISERENMLIINPGTVSDVLTDARTCAIYNTGTRKAESIEL